MERVHDYAVTVHWTGNRGVGTRGYSEYSRDHDIAAEGKSVIQGSSDPAFRGDAMRWNPEELLVASLSACHKLWYLHLCSVEGIVVTDHIDRASGRMVESTGGGGRFVEVVLSPRVTLAAGSDVEVAHKLHHAANEKCFIANSVNFEVRHEPEIVMTAEE